jgi:hypothetical protein
VFAECTRCKTRDGENWKSLTRWAPHPKAALGAVDMTQVGHGVRRRRAVVAAAAALLLVALNGCTGSATSDAEGPSTSGLVATVGHLGVDARLSSAIDSAMSDKDGRHGNVRAVLVIHHGRTLVENYYHSRASDHHNIYSITKSVLSTLVGIAGLRWSTRVEPDAGRAASDVSVLDEPAGDGHHREPAAHDDRRAP